MLFRRLSVFLSLTLPLLVSAATPLQLPDFTSLVEANSPSVVNISTSHKINRNPQGSYDTQQQHPFGELLRRYGQELPPMERDVQSLGSGFIISADGYVVTNYHVVAEADEVMVRLSDKRVLPAEVVGSDRYSDVALLKLKANNLPVAQIGDARSIKVGAWVLAIGSPYGFDHSVTAGIVSAKGRSLPNANYVPFIQTDVAINPGNSGGPLIDLNGKVIGINSQIFSSTGASIGLAFAIPIDVAMDVVQQLKEKGEVSRGWLGVQVQEVTVDLAESFGLKKPMGAMVSQVIDNTPAAKAGILAGDVIVQFNGEEVADSASLPLLVGGLPVGTTAKIKVLREGQYKTLDTTIEKLPGTERRADLRRPAMNNRLGIEVVDLEKDERSRLKRGVRIERLGTNGVAYLAGMRAGDVILQLNKVDIKNAADFRERVAKLPLERLIPVLMQRQGADQFLVLKLPPE